MSAAVAAIVVSKIWPSGTLWATAMTPVVVSIVKEGLERPAQKITQVGVSARYHHDPDDLVVEEVEPSGEPSEVKLYGARKRTWRIALITGLLAAVVAIAALTLPELVAGHSIVSGGKDTTVFGGHRHKAKSKTETTTVQTVTQTQTETTPSTTPTPTQTQTTPTQTETTPAPTETTPTTTVPPATTTTPAP